MMGNPVAVFKVVILCLVSVVLSACKEESLIGTLEVNEAFTFVDSEQVTQSVSQGSYTAYLKQEYPGANQKQEQYRLTLVEKNKPAPETQIIRIPIKLLGPIQWISEGGEAGYPFAKTEAKEPAAFTGSAYVPAHRLNQPFNLELTATYRDYTEKVSTKKDCQVSVASLKSDVGFEHHYYYDGFFLRPYPVRGPVHSMSLEFSARPSYKKVRYTEAGQEYAYGLILKALETQKPLAVGNAKLRVPRERSKVREFTCRPM